MDQFIRFQALMILTTIFSLLTTSTLVARDTINDKGSRVLAASIGHCEDRRQIFVAVVQRGHEHRARLFHHVKAAGRLFQTPIVSGNGEYLVHISFGSPPQKSTAIVDTGSELIWVQCLPCKSCYIASSPTFDPSKSSTYAALSYASNMCINLPFQKCATSCQYHYPIATDRRRAGRWHPRQGAVVADLAGGRGRQ